MHQARDSDNNASYETSKDNDGNVGFVHDLDEFGDDESSDEDEASVVPASAMKNPSTPARPRNVPVPVTPDPVKRESVSVRWVEDDSPLGSCLCGNLIHLKDLSKPVVLCPTCEEPMHMECAGFSSSNELAAASAPIAYRRMFADEQWMCWLGKNDSCCPCCVSDRKQQFESRATLVRFDPVFPCCVFFLLFQTICSSFFLSRRL